MFRKYKGIATLLLVFSLSACDDIKQAYNQTFRPESESQENLEAKYAEAFARASGQAIPNEDIEQNISKDDPKYKSQKPNQSEIDELVAQITELKNKYPIENNFDHQRLIERVKSAPNRNYLESVVREIQREIKAQESSPLNMSEADLKNIQTDLLKMFDGKTPFVLDNDYIYFYFNRIHLSLNDPLNKDYVDRYSYIDGVWTKNEPVKLSKYHLESLAKRRIPLTEVDFAGLSRSRDSALVKAKQVEGGKLSASTRVKVYKDNFQVWEWDIEGDRGDYEYKVNHDGTGEVFERR